MLALHHSTLEQSMTKAEMQAEAFNRARNGAFQMNETEQTSMVAAYDSWKIGKLHHL
jgi:hypothetical protein